MSYLYTRKTLPEYDVSHETFFSSEIQSKELFRVPLSSFNLRREFIIGNSLSLRPELVFPSTQSFNLYHGDIATDEHQKQNIGCPVISVSSNHIPRNYKNGEMIFLSIKRNTGLTFTDFCVVTKKKVPALDCIRYKLNFQFMLEDKPSNLTVNMIETSTDNFIDTKYKGTRLRFVGLSRSDASYGTRSFYLLVVEKFKESLVDELIDGLDPDDPELKSIFSTGRTNGENGILGYKSVINNEHLQSSALSHSFGKYKVEGLEGIVPDCRFNKRASFSVLESMDANQDENSIDGVNIDSLVLLCMTLVTKKREAEKRPPLFTHNVPPGSVNRA